MNSKRYNLVVYQEMDCVKFLQACIYNRGKNISAVKYAYICHNRDDKKEHYHIYIEFPEAVKSRDIETILNLCNISTSALSYDKTNKNFLAYLTHSTPQDIGVKASYNVDEITTNIDHFEERWKEAVEAVNKPSRQQTKILEFQNMMESLTGIIEENSEIISMSTLMNYLLKNGFIEELHYCINKAFAVKMMFEENFKMNIIFNSTHELNDRNKCKIKVLQKEWQEEKEIEQKIEEIEDKVLFYSDTRKK